MDGNKPYFHCQDLKTQCFTLTALINADKFCPERKVYLRKACRKMDRDQLQGILPAFGIRETIAALEPLLHVDDLHKAPPQYKLVARLRFRQSPTLILRLLKEERSPAAYVQEQGELAAFFVERGIPTVAPMKALDGRRYANVPYQGHMLLATLERDLGPEMTSASLETCALAGQLLGRMHAVVLENDVHMQHGKAIFDFAAGSDVDGGPMLRDVLQQHGRIAEAGELYQLYQNRREELLTHWPDSPHGAVQGDLSINNLTQNSAGRLFVFDYNCAGECALISDAVLQGMLFAREMDYPEEETHVTSRQRFSAFFDAYQQQRPLCAAEAALWPSLYQAMDAFWFVRVRYGADSLEMQLAQKPDMPLDAWMEDVQARLHDVSILV